MVIACGDVSEESPAVLLDVNLAVGGVGRVVVGRRQVPISPGGEDSSDVFGGLGPGQQVVGVVERDEALGVQQRPVDPTGVVDTHDVVDRRVEDRGRHAQVTQPGEQVVLLQVVEELLLDLELTTGELHRRASARFDLVDV